MQIGGQGKNIPLTLAGWMCADRGWAYPGSQVVWPKSRPAGGTYSVLSFAKFTLTNSGKTP
jgi:hypothetical protein